MAGRLRALFWLQLGNTVSESLGWSFIYLYAYAVHGLAYPQLAFIFLLSFAVPLPFLALPILYRSRLCMPLGLAAKLLAFALLLSPLPVWRLYPAAAIYALGIPFFWIHFNSHFAGSARRGAVAGASTQLFALYAFGAAILPLLGGQLIPLLGYGSVFLLSALALSASIAYLAWGLRWPGLRIGSGDFAADLAATRPFVLPEGIWQGAFGLGVPLVTLYFLAEPRGYGLFLAFLGTMGGVASLLAGRWSDRRRDRARPLLASALVTSLFSVCAALATSRVEFWGLAVGASYFALYTMYSFTFTLTQEACTGSAPGMLARELWLNLGRVLGGIAVLISLLLLGTAAPALALGGLALLPIAAFGWRLAHGAAGSRRPGTPSAPMPHSPLAR